jgi:ankyrin repeat protein
VDELEKVRALLDAGADIEAPSDGGYTPLHFAVRHGNTGAMKVLLDAGADINTKGSCGRSPLHLAASGDKAGVVRALLDAGADAEASSDGGYTPLHLAASDDKAEVVRALLDAGVDIGASDDIGLHFLQQAKAWVERRRVCCVALAMGQHPHLSNASCLHLLNSGVMRMVLQEYRQGADLQP